MIFYALLILFTILIVLNMYYKYLKDKQKTEQQLQESFENLKNAWNNFKGLF